MEPLQRLGDPHPRVQHAHLPPHLLARDADRPCEVRGRGVRQGAAVVAERERRDDRGLTVEVLSEKGAVWLSGVD